MNNFAITFKELEVAGFQFEYDMSSIMLEDEVFTESVGEKGNFFVRLKNAVITFIDKVIKGIKDFFNKFTTSKASKNIEDAMKKNPAISNAKVKTTDWGKAHVLNKETQKKLKNAKSKEEVDKIMSDYKRKRNVILAATTAVTISLGVLYANLRKGSNKPVSEMEDQKQGMQYEQAVQKEIDVPTTKVSSSASNVNASKPKSNSDCTTNTVVELEKAKAVNDAQIRKNDVADTANEVKETAAKISNEDIKALMNKMNSSAIKLPEEKKKERSENASVLRHMQRQIKEYQRLANATNDQLEAWKVHPIGVANDIKDTVDEFKEYSNIYKKEYAQLAKAMSDATANVHDKLNK